MSGDTKPAVQASTALPGLYPPVPIDGRFYLDTTGNGVWDGVARGDTFRDFGIDPIRWFEPRTIQGRLRADGSVSNTG